MDIYGKSEEQSQAYVMNVECNHHAESSIKRFQKANEGGHLEKSKGLVWRSKAVELAVQKRGPHAPIAPYLWFLHAGGRNHATAADATIRWGIRLPHPCILFSLFR